MRDEAGPLRRALWPLVGAGCLAAGVAGADPLPVNMSILYQRTEVLGVTQESWSRNLDASYATFLNPNLQLSGLFRISSIQFVGLPDRSLSPYGTLALYHPRFGLTGSYRPTSTTNTFGITARQREAQASAFAAPVSLPRLDVLWTRRRVLPQGGTPGGVNESRDAHVLWSRGALDVHAGLGDIRFGSEAVGAVSSTQSNWNAGSAYRLGRKAWSLSGAFDVTSVRSGAGAGPRDASRTENGLLNWTQKLSKRADWGASYQVHGNQFTAGAQGNFTTQEGTVNGSFRPTRATQFFGAAGFRPVTSGDSRTRNIGYVLVTASAQGRVRAAWTGQASMTQSLNHEPSGNSYWVSSYRTGSRLLLARGWTLNLDGSATASGDPTRRDQRVSSQGSVATSAIPLQRLTISYTIRGYRVGPALDRALARSSSQALDVRWQPVRALDLGGNLSHSSALPNGSSTTTTRLLTAQYTPSRRLQVDATYSHSSQTLNNPGGAQVRGNEVWTTRVIAGLGRRYRLSAGGAVADPGKPTRTRQFDASITASFGGGS